MFEWLKRLDPPPPTNTYAPTQKYGVKARFFTFISEDNIEKTNMKFKLTRLSTKAAPVKEILESFNMLNGTNLSLNSGMTLVST